MSNLYGSIEGVFRTKHEVIKNIEEITKRFTRENRDKMVEKCNEFLKRLATTSFMFDFDWVSELLCGDMYKNSFTVRIKMNREKERLVELNNEVIEYKNQFEEVSYNDGDVIVKCLKLCLMKSYIYIINLSLDDFGHPNVFENPNSFMNCWYNIRMIEFNLNKYLILGVVKNNIHKCEFPTCKNSDCVETTNTMIELGNLSTRINVFNNNIGRNLSLYDMFQRSINNRKLSI